MSMRKDVRKLLRTAERQGCGVQRGGGGHYKVRCPGGLVTVSGSPSDQRALKSIQRDLSKAGVVLNPIPCGEIQKLGTVGEQYVYGGPLPSPNPIVAPGISLVSDDDRNVDEMAAAAARFGEMWARYFDQYGARYSIEWGIVEPGDVTTRDVTGTYKTHLPANFQVVITHCFDREKPPEHETELAGDVFLERSGLDEFMYYDGWESGSCDSPDPREWPKNFWYEEKRTGDLFTYQGFEAHVRRPQIVRP